MNINEIQHYIETKKNRVISQSEIAKALGKDRSNVCNKAKRGTELKISEIEKIEKYFNINLFTNLQQKELPTEQVEIEYIHVSPSCGNGTFLLENPEITPISLGMPLIQKVFKVKNPNYLKIFKASGDSMEKTIFDEDLLLVDTSVIDCVNGGVYLLMRNNDFYCKRLHKLLSGDLEIISDNSMYGKEVISLDSDIEIKIIGRVVKNLSRGL